MKKKKFDINSLPQSVNAGEHYLYAINQQLDELIDLLTPKEEKQEPKQELAKAEITTTVDEPKKEETKPTPAKRKATRTKK